MSTRRRYLEVKLVNGGLKYLGFDMSRHGTHRNDYVDINGNPYDTESYLGDFRRWGNDKVADSPTPYLRRHIFCDEVEWVRPAGFDPENVDMLVQSKIQFRVMKPSDLDYTNYMSVTGNVWLQEYPNFKKIERDKCGILGGNNACCAGCSIVGSDNSTCTETNFTCECYTGYNGTLCEECAEGYHVQDGECVQCKSVTPLAETIFTVATLFAHVCTQTAQNTPMT